MARLLNRAKMTTSTVGTGPITLGAPLAGFQSFTDAGLQDGESLRYVIEDGPAWEIGTAVFDASTNSLSRAPAESSLGGAMLSLSGTAVVFAAPQAGDFLHRGMLTLIANDQTIPAGWYATGETLLGRRVISYGFTPTVLLPSAPEPGAAPEGAVIDVSELEV